jgi:hypothetical protein
VANYFTDYASDVYVMFSALSSMSAVRTGRESWLHHIVLLSTSTILCKQKKVIAVT